ncbi:DNA polymerase III subunit chi [Candidatus Pantoea edessiphila]|uniref:DNA polymerase III subunit chi n=1 Tax=Candidatus Pantoea edessiphila TaxID=2044610 RepID=A0A2P5SW56_9GAMM|nr:DNA polymerase III subunit chi [Candidatus Pantoea edessiphila]PPI86568.1 DNA polymerase III subunit chi [Candidatus Pantoea edessiphila]
MKKVIFYVIKSHILSCSSLNYFETLTSYIARKYWYQGKRVLIYCENIKQAIRIDKNLWKDPLNAFIPHNLFKEGIIGRGPIEIICSQNKINFFSYDILINLFINFTNCIGDVNEIIDFVPQEDHLKKLARIRYREYRKLGFKFKITVI